MKNNVNCQYNTWGPQTRHKRLTTLTAALILVSFPFLRYGALKTSFENYHCDDKGLIIKHSTITRVTAGLLPTIFSMRNFVIVKMNKIKRNENWVNRSVGSCYPRAPRPAARDRRPRCLLAVKHLFV